MPGPPEAAPIASGYRASSTQFWMVHSRQFTKTIHARLADVRFVPSASWARLWRAGHGIPPSYRETGTGNPNTVYEVAVVNHETGIFTKILFATPPRPNYVQVSK